MWFFIADTLNLVEVYHFAFETRLNFIWLLFLYSCLKQTEVKLLYI